MTLRRLNRLECLVTILQGQLLKQPPSPKKTKQQLQEPFALWDHPRTVTREECGRKLCHKLARLRRKKQQGQQDGRRENDRDTGNTMLASSDRPHKKIRLGHGSSSSSNSDSSKASWLSVVGHDGVLREDSEDDDVEGEGKGEGENEPVAIWGISRSLGGISAPMHKRGQKLSPISPPPRGGKGKGMIWRGKHQGAEQKAWAPSSACPRSPASERDAACAVWVSNSCELPYTPQPSLEKLRLRIIGCRDR